MGTFSEGDGPHDRCTHRLSLGVTKYERERCQRETFAAVNREVPHVSEFQTPSGIGFHRLATKRESANLLRT